MLILLTSKSKYMKWNYYVGIDVSKNHLDYAVMLNNEFLFGSRTANDQEGIELFFNELKSLADFNLDQCLFCMEHTGIYNNPFIYFLKDKNADICLESGLHIKLSGGLQRGKNDKIDALRIAQYSYKNREEIKLWIPKRAVLVRLEALSVLTPHAISKNCHSLIVSYYFQDDLPNLSEL
jgi:transposase